MQHAVTRFMRAHGNTPGPTHRPKIAGALSGAIAGAAAAPLLWALGSVAAVSAKTGLYGWSVEVLFLVSMAILGALYGEVFGRGANDKRGGWLLGLSYGFLLWLVGPVTFLQWFLPSPAATGHAALGLIAAQILYGAVLGLVFPYIHDLIQRELHAL